MRKLIRWVSTLGLLLAAHVLDAQIDRITGKSFATRSEVLARHGMVCTSVPAATQIGLDILKREREQTLRDQRKRAFAAGFELRADEGGTSEAAPRDHSSDRHAADQCAGNGGRLGRAAQEIRQTEIER